LKIWKGQGSDVMSKRNDDCEFRKMLNIYNKAIDKSNDKYFFQQDLDLIIKLLLIIVFFVVSIFVLVLKLVVL